MKPIWFQPRGYRHLDVPVGNSFALKAEQAEFVSAHSFSPLLHFDKVTKRYRPLLRKTEVKKRPIMYASHRDACILSKYAHDLTSRLESSYAEMELSDCVIAYRKLGRSNYDFSADVLGFARENAPCSILCFDVADFFGTLDHKLLKRRLKSLLNVTELPDDWFQIFRHVTRYSWVSRDDLRLNPKFADRAASGSRGPIATIAEAIEEGICIHRNQIGVGIPQGTPISSVLANLYMIDVDAAMQRYASQNAALYRRYSDDILFACSPSEAATAEQTLQELVSADRLSLNQGKTERHIFDPSRPEGAQYLGFNLSPGGAAIRSSSIARQWRKVRRSVSRIQRIGEAAIAAGKADKIYTRALRRRFSALPVRNFSSYARRAAEALESEKIIRQVRRLERYLDRRLEGFAKSRKS